MNKKAFINELGRRLYVLDASERKDILNEYSDTIDEKVKHGKTEEEAIADFGNIDELVKEILSAYKINPNFDQHEESDFKKTTKELGNSFERFIKEGAAKLSDFTRDVVEEVKNHNENITIELVFEILLKGLVMLIIFAVLAFPFAVFRELGLHIFDFLIFPLNHLLGVVWYIIVAILYFLTCALVAIAMFKDYFKNRGNDSKKDGKKKSENNKKKEKITSEEKIQMEETKSPIVSDKKEKKHPILDIFTLIVKVGIIFMTLPLLFLNIGIACGLCFIIFLMFKGIFFIDALLVGIGCALIFGHLQNIIYTLTLTKKKVRFYPFIIGACLLFLGGLFMFDRCMNLKYVDDLPENAYVETKEEFIEDITKTTVLENDNITLEIDNSLEDGKMRVIVYYYPSSNGIQPYWVEGEDKNYYRIQNDRQGAYNDYQLFFKTLESIEKEKTIYDYNKLLEVRVNVYTNEKTRPLLHLYDD